MTDDRTHAANRSGMDLEGQVALVTGGGSGLGEAICRVLSEAGATVVAADLRVDRAERVALLNRAAGGEGIALRLDVTDEDQAEEAVRQTLARFDRLDILVNSAGVDVTLPFDELSVGEWDRIIAVNLRGPFIMAHYAFPVMRERGRGHIVNIISTAAKRAWPNASAYHASKWGLLGLSHAMHVEARPHRVKVTAVVSGGMRTPFLLDRFPDIDLATLQDPRNVAQTIRFILTQPEETVIPEVLVLPMGETSWP
jgi:NAD(P)-dependent dehydrogenase (short-subunit alcohol dehydrogenase family)